jgi:hypothetical protein
VIGRGGAGAGAATEMGGMADLEGGEIYGSVVIKYLYCIICIQCATICFAFCEFLLFKRFI